MSRSRNIRPAARKDVSASAASDGVVRPRASLRKSAAARTAFACPRGNERAAPPAGASGDRRDLVRGAGATRNQRFDHPQPTSPLSRFLSVLVTGSVAPPRATTVASKAYLAIA